jgi:hypothetical protein
MKASDFVNLMRKVIREEVRSIVREELKTIKPLLKETTQQGFKAGLPAATPKAATPARKPAITPPTFEGPLAGLLNETYESMINEPMEDDEWPDMNGGALTADHAQVGVQSMSSLSAMMDDDSPLPDGGGYSDPTRAFMKDYSAVLKAADQHRMGN